MREAPDNILFFHSGSIGDFLMYLYLAEQFRHANPNVRVRIVMPRNAEFLQGFLHRYPYITLIEISKWKLWLLPTLFMDGRNLVAVIHPTIGHIPARIKLLGWLLTRRRGATLIGFTDRGPFCNLYSHQLRYDAEMPYYQMLSKVLQVFGILPTGAPTLLFDPTPAVLEKYGLTKGKYVVVHPLSATGSFDRETVIQLVRSVNRERPDLRVVLSGGEKDRVWLASVAALVSAVIRAVGDTAEDLASLLSGAHLYIGVDTGTSHLACLLGVRAIVAAHESTQINWLPWYAPHATILYRLKQEDEAHGEWEYLLAHRGGKIQPFGAVPAQALTDALARALEPQ